MRSVDADSGVYRLDLPKDPVAIEALIAANRARIAELKTLPAGGMNSLGELALTEHGRWVIAELAMATAGTMITAMLVRAGALPLAFLGFCACVWLPVGLLVVTLGLGLGRACMQLARWVAVPVVGEHRSGAPGRAPECAARCGGARRRMTRGVRAGGAGAPRRRGEYAPGLGRRRRAPLGASAHRETEPHRRPLAPGRRRSALRAACVARRGPPRLPLLERVFDAYIPAFWHYAEDRSAVTAEPGSG